MKQIHYICIVCIIVMINYSCSSNNINENKSYVESFIYRYDLQVNDSFIGIINYQTIGDYIKEAKKLNQTQKEALFKGIIEIPIEQIGRAHV